MPDPDLVKHFASRLKSNGVSENVAHAAVTAVLTFGDLYPQVWPHTRAQASITETETAERLLRPHTEAALEPLMPHFGVVAAALCQSWETVVDILGQELAPLRRAAARAEARARYQAEGTPPFLTGGAPPPYGCRRCGLPPRTHYMRYTPGSGYHQHTPPTTGQIKARMLRRRADRAAWLRALDSHTPDHRPTDDQIIARAARARAARWATLSTHERPSA